MENEDLMEMHQERMCDLCSDCFFEGSVNSNQYNLCEGSKCDDAVELLKEELDGEKYDRRRYLLIRRK
jgi:hypothetical protein